MPISSKTRTTSAVAGAALIGAAGGYAVSPNSLANTNRSALVTEVIRRMPADASISAQLGPHIRHEHIIDQWFVRSLEGSSLRPAFVQATIEWQQNSPIYRAWKAKRP